jgi:hypothetical protein
VLGRSDIFQLGLVSIRNSLHANVSVWFDGTISQQQR